QDLYLRDGGQRVDHLAHTVGQHKTGEFTADGCRNAADRDRGGASGGVGAGGLTAAGQDAGEFVPEIELRAVIQRVVQGDFGDRRLDQHLQRNDVELAQHPLDDCVFARGGIDQERVVTPVGDDPDAVFAFRSGD